MADPVRALRKLALAAFCACALAILALALLPPSGLPSTPWDKANHSIAFAVLGLLGALAWPARRNRVTLALVGYGVAIELLQALMPYRSAEALDVVADAVGLLAAELAVRGALSVAALRRR